MPNLRSRVTRPTRHTRRDLTGLTKREALKVAKTLLPRARAGSREDAEMLVDVAIYAGFPTDAEYLQLALRGLSYPAGHALPPDAAARNLSDTLARVQWTLFPPRNRPCLPDRRDFTALVADTLDMTDRVDRGRARALWKLLERACADGGWRAIEGALIEANNVIRGHGVEMQQVQTRRGPDDLSFEYVNMGDSYSTTLLYDHHADRFRITSWGDMIEMWERRWGEPGGYD